MFSLFKPKTPVHLEPRQITIEGIDQPIDLQDKETLLHAALRNGVPFPNRCRVGACATCKCQLLEGKVRELTESAYVVSKEELDQGFILVCQSVPQTDIRVKVEFKGVHHVSLS